MSDTDSNNPIGVAPEKLASLDAAQAAAIFEQGKDAVVFALLAMAKRLSESQSPTVNPATPSGMIPVYQKPPAKKRKKKPAQKPIILAVVESGPIASTIIKHTVLNHASIAAASLTVAAKRVFSISVSAD